MSRKAFNKLLFFVGPLPLRDETMGRKAKRECITPEVRLSICLRMLAGTKAIDGSTIYFNGRSTSYSIFRETRDALHTVLSLDGLPKSFKGLSRMAHAFQTSRKQANPLPGCVGALDGISIRIKKPPDDEKPARFWCRKGYYAIPVQAVCDSNYRFLEYYALCEGATHDSLALGVSSLGGFLEQGELRNEFWLAGDEAYVCTNTLITPFPRTQTAGNDEKDDFNFLHSSMRMHIEQAFGMLVNKWLLLRKLELSVNDSADTIGLAMKLHNFCIDHDSGFQEYAQETAGTAMRKCHPDDEEELRIGRE